MKGCELCDQEASLYCPSDSAFLCSDCDTAVHGANFLVARHLRRLLCSKCHRFAGIDISGAISRHLSSTCSSCSPENLPSDSLPSSSICVSSSESCVTKKIKAAKKPGRRNGKAEEVFEKWSREIGLRLGENGNRVASNALGLSLCLGKSTFRVAAATSFWLGLRFCGDTGLATCHNLARLEAISGVPAKLILATHANLARVFTHRRELKEGWGESYPS